MLLYSLIYFNLSLFLICYVFFRYLCTADTKLPYAYEQCTSKEMLWQAVKQGRIFIHIFAFVLNKQELNLTHRRQNLAFHDALSIRDTRFYHQTWLCSFVLCSLQESAPSTSLSLMTSVGAWWNDVGKARRRSAFSSESFSRFLKAFTSDSRSTQRTGYTTGNHDAMASADCNSVCQLVILNIRRTLRHKWPSNSLYWPGKDCIHCIQYWCTYISLLCIL